MLKFLFFFLMLGAAGAYAEKFPEDAGRYIKMYSSLIGPYPGERSSIAEKPGTGARGASFNTDPEELCPATDSAYQRLILRNWLGGGAPADGGGDWAEGLTAYLAGHLTAEGEGGGRGCRMAALQKYSKGGGDVPLAQFRPRRPGVCSEPDCAKSMMFFHMLRSAIGDASFKKGLRDLYSANPSGSASYAELRAAFERQTGSGRLARFFEQWTDRPGAPELALKNARLLKTTDGYNLEFTLAQVQKGPLYDLEVPAAIYLENSDTPRVKKLTLRSAEETFHYDAPLRPVRLEIDPEFDIFRKLNPLEAAPVLANVIAADNSEMFLPSGQAKTAWENFASAWPQRSGRKPALSDDSLKNSPPLSAAYWVLGDENRLAIPFEQTLYGYGVRVSPDSVTVGSRRFRRMGATFVFTAPNPGAAAYCGALVLSENMKKLPDLAAKLPLYGKYSWLVFDNSMTLLASGEWEPARSPLSFDLGGDSQSRRHYPPRSPLAEPASPFSADNIAENIYYLYGTREVRGRNPHAVKDPAARIAASFNKYGLKPFRAGGFQVPLTAVPGGPVFKDIIGAVAGTGGKKDEYIILGADFGQALSPNGVAAPDDDAGAPGAAILLELARYYAAHPAPRTLIFAAFTREEEGRPGSAFLSGLPRDMAAKAHAAVKIDSGGRLEGGKILARASASLDKWVDVFSGAGFVMGSGYDISGEDPDSRDRMPFLDEFIPALRLFSAPGADKAPLSGEDTDAAGMVKQADFARGIIDYLAGDAGSMTAPEATGPSALP